MLEIMNRIPVALATDDTHVLPMSVTVASILANAAADTFYDIYIYTKNELPAQTAQLLLSFESAYPRCAIHLNVFDESPLEKAVVKVKHLGIANFYRLLLPGLLPELDKCIYLDTDTIVMADLAELFNLSLGDNYVAGVRAAGYRNSEIEAKKYARSLRLPNLNEYINNGVMLINLSKMREDNVQDKMVKLTSKGFRSPCQDITNYVCYGRIKRLPLRYNFATKIMKPSEEAFFKNRGCKVCYSRAEYRDAVARPVVIHFANQNIKGPTKPWNKSGLHHADRWWKYARLSPLWPEVQSQYGKFDTEATK